MRYGDKLMTAMLRRGLNQHRLAALADVSNSEVSRILNNKSSPSLEYASRLCRILEISLDFLADETRDEPETIPVGPPTSLQEREILEDADLLGWKEARHLLETANLLGYETAIHRLLGLGPIKIEVEGTEPRTPPKSPNRANRA